MLLAFRILDELMIKEYKSHLNMHGEGAKDFATRMFTKEMFLKGVFVCAMESVLFVNVVKSTYSYDLMKQVQIKPFDFWRLMNSFMKFDPQMPKQLLIHFREIEVKIVSEVAW